MPTLAALQGIWQSAAGDATSTSAIVLPDGRLWAVQVSGTGGSTTTRVLKATLAVQGNGYSAAGKSYTLGGSTSAPATAPVVASVVEKTRLDVRVGTDAIAETLSLAWQGRYDTGASLAGFAGAWSATLGPGTLRWNIDAQGRITGVRTTGCTYTGQLRPRTDVKVYQASVVETCSTGTKSFAGVATHRAAAGSAPAALTLVVVSTDAAETSALAVLLNKN